MGDYNCILSHKIREILGEVSGNDVSLINSNNTGDDNGQEQDWFYILSFVNQLLFKTY